MTDDETWRPIPGFDGYDVSDLGRVRSWKPYRGAPGPRVLKAYTNPDGYATVSLHRDGRQVTQSVHAAVMLAFVGPRPEGREVRHLDGNPSNSVLANLVYGTTSENQKDSVRHGTNFWSSRDSCPQGHAYDQANTRLTSRGTRVCRACSRKWAAATAAKTDPEHKKQLARVRTARYRARKAQRTD